MNIKNAIIESAKENEGRITVMSVRKYIFEASSLYEGIEKQVRAELSRMAASGETEQVFNVTVLAGSAYKLRLINN